MVKLRISLAKFCIAGDLNLLWLQAVPLFDRLDCCIGRKPNDNFVSISFISFGCDVVCDGSWRSRRLCFPPELGSVQKTALARFWRVDRSGASGSRVELVCSLTELIGNWSLVIGHW